jgi:hypothetical protein
MQKYPCLLQTRVSQSERHAIIENANKAGMSVCKFLRERATGRRVQSTIEAGTIAAVNRVGGMVKLLLRESQPNAPEIIAELKALRLAIERKSEAVDEDQGN